MPIQYLLRTLRARKSNHDGSVSLGRWRAPLVLPLLALVQMLFAGRERLTDDASSCLGWSAVAAKPARSPSSYGGVAAPPYRSGAPRHRAIVAVE